MSIKLFAMDVDGTMTDGKIYIGAQGEMMKAFNVKDGQGIAQLIKSGIVVAIITARESEIVNRRAAELRIPEVVQGCKSKDEALMKLCDKYGCALSEVAYIGDDIGDLPAMKIAGVSFCPADSVQEVLSTAAITCSAKGGYGAVREACEWILHNGR